MPWADAGTQVRANLVLSSGAKALTALCYFFPLNLGSTVYNDVVWG